MTHALTRTCMLLALGAVGAAQAAAQTSGDSVAIVEAAYAVSVARVADSAIHRLDFFPSRTQMRVQMLFIASHDSSEAVFDEIGRRSLGAAVVVDDMVAAFRQTRVPDDLHDLHAELVSSLEAARSALDRLAAASTACESGVRSVQRCQSPFTAASTELTKAYKRYLSVRVKIRDQIRDTQTVLPEFKKP